MTEISTQKSVTFFADDVSRLSTSAKQLLEFCGPVKVITFTGNLGAGKTTFIKAICEELCVIDSVSSPTFSIINEYRTKENIPEMRVEGIEFVFGVGGENKANSSSWILEEWRSPKTPRPWGYYRVLHDVAGTKVKELTIDPGQSLSMQYHNHRSEHWHVSEGRCEVKSMMSNGYTLPPKTLEKHGYYNVPATHWHQLTNPFD